MNTELVTKQTTALADMPLPQGSWGAENTTATDLVIPKLLIMQGLSDFVTDEKLQARQGEIRDSLEGRLLAKVGEPLKVIPFFFYNTWVEFEERNGKFEFTGITPRDHTNELAPQDWEEAGKKKRRDRTINCYVLLESELGGGEFLPYLLSFSRTGFKTGKKLVTLVEKLKQFNLAPAHRVFELSAAKVSNDKGTWFGPEIAQVGETSKEHLALAYKWYMTVSKGGVKVDNSDLVSSTPEMSSVEGGHEF